MKDFNTISVYGCPMEPSVPDWANPNVPPPAIVYETPPPQDPTLETEHVAHALLRLYGFALEGAKPHQHDELEEHFRTLGKALGVM